MSDTRTKALNWRVRGTTLAENLTAAVADGRIAAHPDGTFAPAAPQPDVPAPCLYSNARLKVSCDTQMMFLFRSAYGSKTVPHGCRACYKVKVIARTVRELFALYEVAKATPYIFKCGLDTVPSSACLYSAFFYADGLDAARDMFAVLRRTIDLDAKLGPDVAMHIKRGCTEYEVSCGPSDQYTFAPELADVEAALLTLWKPSPRRKRTSMDGVRTLSLWIQTAFKHGDETYRDFTNGQSLYPATLKYDPVAPDK